MTAETLLKELAEKWQKWADEHATEATWDPCRHVYILHAKELLALIPRIVELLNAERDARAIVWEILPEKPGEIGGELRLERRDGFKGRRWAITRRGGYVLNKVGAWEYEPIPSSRTEEWLKTVRWESADDAICAALAASGEQRKAE